MGNERLITAEGAAKLREELIVLKGRDRDAIAKRLRSAIQQGDLSENADYHKAKEDQSFLEGRIMELEYLLKNATVVEAQEGKHETVEVGAKVTVQEEDFPPETYDIVGLKEADPRNGRISNESPIGNAMMGKREGDFVTVITPDGEIKLKILKVE
ncbi:MAG: transcription elongation factor GreA [Chloroflexi bacterium RBG_16_54_18]|nr:MAG: transcription elongation factor GreA [Chloroflexi bacterium RBG_16_54_18]